MSEKLQYLYQRQTQLHGVQEDIRKQLKKLKLLIFIEALIMCACVSMNFSPSEFSFLGIKVDATEFSKIVLIFPFILSYQYVYYRLSRVDQKRTSFRHAAISKEIESEIGVDINELYSKNEYISRRGNVYSISHQDIPVKILMSVIKSITWLPVVFVYLLAFQKGPELLSNNPKYLTPTYITAVILSIFLIFFVRVVGHIVYRKKTSSNQSVDPTWKTPLDEIEV